MSNSVCCTEDQIKQQSKNLFFVQGSLNASSQEIADFAGVQRTSVNYYFRNKENLKKVIYEELLAEIVGLMNEIYISSLPFLEKIEALIDRLMSFKLTYPYFEFFNVAEVYKKALHQQSIVHPNSTKNVQFFLKEAQEQIDLGKINCSDPFDLLINITSLVSYPIMLRPLFLDLYQMNDNNYDQLLQNRKAQILNLLIIK